MSKTVSLTAQVRIYIPRSKLRNTFIRNLVKITGGCTEVPVFGTWLDGDKLIREASIRVEAWFPNERATEVFELVTKEVRRLHNAKEQAVLFEFFTAKPDEGASIHFA